MSTRNTMLETPPLSSRTSNLGSIRNPARFAEIVGSGLGGDFAHWRWVVGSAGIRRSRLRFGSSTERRSRRAHGWPGRAGELSDALRVTAHQGRRVEPEAGKDLAAVEAGVVERQTNEFAFPQYEPIDLPIEHAPDDVLPYAIAAINVELGVQVVAGTACRDLGDELRGVFKVVVGGDSRLAAMIRVDEKDRVGLRLVVQVEANAGVVGTDDAGRGDFVNP